MERGKKGFTLIELMVVISIIAILSTVGYVTYSHAQITARDARRKDDLRQIATALTIYYQINKRYPCSGSGWETSTNTTSIWIKDVNTDSVCDGSKGNLTSSYINQIPIDPSGNGGNAFKNNNLGYAYSTDFSASCPAEGTYFALVTNLENGQDPDAEAQKNYVLCDGSKPSSNNAFVITSQ